jgi:hemerythrin-like domain-containing protein
MNHSALRVIRDEHASLAAMLESMLQMIKRGPDADGKHAPEQYFDVLRAMLFYIDEFPEKLHHPKESDLLFPRIARAAPHVMRPSNGWSATTRAVRCGCANSCTC